MPLHRKRRRFRLGAAEAVGFALLVATLAAGLSWILEQGRKTGFQRTTGRIVQVVGSDAAAPRLIFTYSVNGTQYANVTKPDFAGRTLASVLPASIMARLTEHGIVTFDDLPEEARREIREGTTHSFNELDAQDRQALQDRGYENAEQLRLALLSAMDGGPSARLASDAHARALNVDVAVSVLYDPRHPSRSEIVAPGGYAMRQAVLGGLTPFVIAIFVTCAYFGVAYPRLKRARA